MAVAVVGLLDQTNDSMIPHYEEIKISFQSDKDFMERVEASMPDKAKILQLPYVPFPENPQVNNMSDYDHLKAYLHSNKLLLSYPTMKGRETAEWLNNTSHKPPQEMIKTLKESGFKGIYIDTYGYKDQGKDIAKKIKKNVNVTPIQSENKRLVFFDIT